MVSGITNLQLTLPDLKIIIPKDVSIIINEALAHGWKPSEKGKPMSFIFEENILTPIH
jgi:hypothetical protein